jgi:pyridoxamine 5'-phosphate oxidase
MDLAALRDELRARGLHRDELAADPIDQFEHWFAVVRDGGVVEPEAVVLTTVDADGRPSSRNVLLRGIDRGTFVFFTNYESRKARAIAANPRVALLFSWVVVARQYTVEGVAERLTAEQSDQYWVTRPRGSQLGAWASPQSSVVPDRAALDDRFAELESLYAGRDVPRPEHWGGYRVVPDIVELWQGRADRLHDRFRYRRDPSSGDGWVIERLAP